MSKASHLFQEFFRNLWRNPGTTFSGLLSMALLFLLFDLFWIGAGTSNRFYENLLSDLQMEVFLNEEIADSSLVNIKQGIDSVVGVTAVEFVSKDKAREELSRLVGIDLLVGYDSTNPLPQSFIISFDPTRLTAGHLAQTEETLLKIPGVSHVYYSRNWLQKAEQTKGIIFNVGMILGGLILLAVLISSTNNIRLMARARAVGFAQMRLLGAGKWFLALPFLIEGFVLAGLSAALGWLVVIYWRGRLDFTQFEIVFPSLGQVLLFCATAALLGMVSGYLGIRKLLRL